MKIHCPSTIPAGDDSLNSLRWLVLAAGLLAAASPARAAAKADWLVNPAPFKAEMPVAHASREVCLQNGLVQRWFSGDAAMTTISLDNLVTKEALLRSVRPEAIVILDGTKCKIGGLVGQPTHNFLKSEWLSSMKPDPTSWHCVGLKAGATAKRFDWLPRKEWMSVAPVWPPPGVSATFEYAATPAVLEALGEIGNAQREVLLEDNFTKLAAEWKIHASPASPRSSFQNEGKAGEIMAAENTCVFAERSLPSGVKVVQALVDPGTDKSASWGPGMALVWPGRVVKFYLRPGKHNLGLNDNGSEAELDAIEEGKPYWLRMQIQPGALRCEYSRDGQAWKNARTVNLPPTVGEPTAVRLGKTSKTGGKEDFPESGEVERCHIKQFTAFGRVRKDPQAPSSALAQVRVFVHYELYDGLPLFAKWLTISNGAAASVTLDQFTVEQLAVVEPESIVDGPAANFRTEYRNLEAFSDFSFGGNMSPKADAPAIRWKSDPQFGTQVHYERQTPCLLECSPALGPAAEIKPGATFTTFRVFELIHDHADRERRGLAMRRAYRALAPWVQENPILMHVRSASPASVKAAVDQCADVGFEMVIMTFGSGFNIENEKPEYLAQLKELAAYAKGKGIALGGYSLLASRSINAENDALNPATGKPGGMRFGSSPCLGSKWGQDYFRKLYQFFEATGCGILEHDGSYPGDFCAATNHPGHRGLNDSLWNQWKMISEFYQWCRARGIYLNVPDWYYLAGSTKCGMGYRENNWSLPRDQQEIIERQNIFDGTWEKTPSMGWMFVPLVEYHGGGPAATIEPLKDHLDHYETRLANLFGAGVQACYRGPRLYDAPETRAVVKRWVDFYRQHRAILDSDLLHLRRPDGRDWDGWMHVNPALPERGLAMIYNPLSEPIEREIRLPLYYTGLTDKAAVLLENGRTEKVTLARDYSAVVKIKIPARGRTWVVVKEK